MFSARALFCPTEGYYEEFAVDKLFRRREIGTPYVCQVRDSHFLYGRSLPFHRLLTLPDGLFVFLGGSGAGIAD